MNEQELDDWWTSLTHYEKRSYKMQDKYNETIYCSRCRREIVDKKDLHLDSRGMVCCTRCHKDQEFKEYSNIDNAVLGQRVRFNIPNDKGDD